MSDIKLVVTDIDGTLVPDRADDATPTVHAVMRSVQSAGVTVAAATARPHGMAQGLFEKLGFKGPCIFDGGASIRDVETGELQWSNWLNVERLKAIAQIVAPHAEMIDCFPGFQSIPIVEFSVDDINEAAPYVWCMVFRTELPGIVERLQQLGRLNVHMIGDWPQNPDSTAIQVTDIDADKYHAVMALQKLLGVSPEQTLAIGDGSNDVPLFRSANTRVAMGNAVPELKALANHEVADVEHNGWAEAMQRFVLV
jgi:HAD superfamily hydrolase (TIGR01484 family)